MSHLLSRILLLLTLAAFLSSAIFAQIARQAQPLDIREDEHQELFYFDSDPAKPIDVHIPSPLVLLGNFLYARAPLALAEQMKGVSVTFKGQPLLQDYTTPSGTAKQVVAAKQAGMAWYCLGKAMTSRGDFQLLLRNWPAELKRADVLFCTWPRFVESGMADDWLAAQTDPLWAPTGVPLGGIGGGRVDICRDGRFRNFSMNNNQDTPVEDPDGLPNAYLAVECNGVVTELTSRPIMPGHKACPQLRFAPRFPQATLLASAVLPGIDVSVTLSGTLCPHNPQYSSIPGFLVRWTVKNTGKKTQQVRCRLGWPNLIGLGGGVAEANSGIWYGKGYYHRWEDPTTRRIDLTCGFDRGLTRYTGAPAAKYLASAGEHLLAVAGKPGQVPGVSNRNNQGGVYADLNLTAGASTTVTMALVTAMPHWVDSLGVDRGMQWQNYYADGDAMLDTLLSKADDILQQTGALAALLDDSTLPDWLRQRLSNCTYPLVTNSVWYRDGRFSINEGPTQMAGCYGTLDQRLAAHPATQLLFPELNAAELSEFAALQAPNGGVTHDLGMGNLERKSEDMTWPDLTCSFIIQCARHAWSTGDEKFAAAMWPHVRHALQRHAQWATAGNGVAQLGDDIGTSYDCYHYLGTTAYVGTLWVAALNICEQWARQQGDTALLTDIPRWRQAALARMEKDLWNGKYYFAYGNAAGLRRETFHAGQLAGEVFSRMLCGADVVAPEKLTSCLNSFFALNGSDRFAVPPDEAGADGKLASPYGWLPYVEGYMLSAAATQADARLWPLWQRMDAVVADHDRHPCDTRLMYRPQRGELRWGTYYMTAPASWLVYDAWLDFFYTPANGALRLRATQPGRYPIVHPLFWATAEVAKDGAVTLTVKKTFSPTPLSLNLLAVPATAKVTVDGHPLTAEAGIGNYHNYRLPQPVTLQPGVQVKWRVE